MSNFDPFIEDIRTQGDLREMLAQAWEDGYLAGHLTGLDQNLPTPENPYRR